MTLFVIPVRTRDTVPFLVRATSDYIDIWLNKSERVSSEICDSNHGCIDDTAHLRTVNF